jgi:hypothetical protein
MGKSSVEAVGGLLPSGSCRLNIAATYPSIEQQACL